MYNNYGPPQGYAPQGYGPPQGFAPQGYGPPQGYGGPPTSYHMQAGGGAPPQYNNMMVHANPQGGMMNGNMHYEYSSMQGKRKALLIGINYAGMNSALRGCWNDVHNMANFIHRFAGYKHDDMVLLTDEPGVHPKSVPTRANIVAAMQWLVAGAQQGDALFFHYSGHGGQERAVEGDEEDGYNETILPLDYNMTGQMPDDELHARLVRPLPIGCRLTALFDSCHSGTALDLPYVYSTSGNIKETNISMNVGKGILGAAMNYARGDIGGVVSGLMSTFKTATTGSGAAEYTRQTRSSGADVIMLSGCKDSQTSADATEAGRATGAMSWAFIKVLSEYSQLSYLQLLNATRYVLPLIQRRSRDEVLAEAADERVAPHRHEPALCRLVVVCHVIGPIRMPRVTGSAAHRRPPLLRRGHDADLTMSTHPGEYVYALYNFDAENPDEVSFKVGERVLVVEKDDAYGDGWFQGTNVRGDTGLFPFSYTTYDQAAAQTMLDGAANAQNAAPAEPKQEAPSAGAAVLGGASASAAPTKEAEPGVMRSTMADIDNAITELHTKEGRQSDAGSQATDADLDEDEDGEHDFAARAAAREALAKNAQKSLALAAQQEQPGPWSAAAGLGDADLSRDANANSLNMRHISLGTTPGVTPLAYLEMSDESEDEQDAENGAAEPAAPAADDSHRREALQQLEATKPTESQATTTTPSVLGSVAAAAAVPAAAVGAAVGLTKETSPAAPEANNAPERAAPVATQAEEELSLPGGFVSEPSTREVPAPPIAEAPQQVPDVATEPLEAPSADVPAAAREVPPVPSETREAPAVPSEAPAPAAEVPPTESAPAVPVVAAAPTPSVPAVPSPSMPAERSVPAAPTSLPWQMPVSAPEPEAKVAPSATQPELLHASQPSQPASPLISETAPTSPALATTPSAKNPETWSVDEVLAWARSKNYDQPTIEKLAEHEISGDALLAMDINLLKEIDIVAFGRRFHLANGIKELREQAGSGVPVPAAAPAASPAAAPVTQSPPASAPLSTPVSAPFSTPPPSTFATGATSVRDTPTSQPEWSVFGLGGPASASPVGPKVPSKVETPISPAPAYWAGSSFGLAPPAGLAPAMDREVQPAEPPATIRSVEPSAVPSAAPNTAPVPVVSAPRAERAPAPAPLSAPPAPAPPAPERRPVQQPAPEPVAAPSPAREPSTSSRRLHLPGRGIFGPRKAPREPEEDARSHRASVVPNKAQISLPTSNANYSVPAVGAGVGAGVGAAAGAGAAGAASAPSDKPEPQTIVPVASGPPAVPSKGSEASPLVLHKIAPVEMQGWIKKKGERYNTWNSRYIALKGSDLIILRDPAAEKVKSHINMRGYKVVADESTSLGRYGFKIVHESDRPHFFSLDDPLMLRNWMKGMMKASIDRDHSQPVISSYSNPTISLEEAQRLKPRPPSPGSRQRMQREHGREVKDQLTAKDESVLRGLTDEKVLRSLSGNGRG